LIRKGAGENIRSALVHMARDASLSSFTRPFGSDREELAANVVEDSNIVNGFLVGPEESIRLDSSSVAPFSMPPEVSMLDMPAASDSKILKRRRLLGTVVLTSSESESFRSLQEMAKQQRVRLSRVMALAAPRYLERAGGNAKQALKQMVATQAWRDDYFRRGPLTVEDVAEDLKLGLVYLAGRDAQMRPVLMFRPNRIPAAWQKDTALGVERVTRLMVFCMEYMLQYMLVPGRIESGIIVADLQGVVLSQVPMKCLIQIIKLMSTHYVNRITKFYVSNLPSSLSRAAKVAECLLTERQRQKITIVRVPTDITQHFVAHQLEEDLGGSKPLQQEFFPFDLPPGPFDPSAPAGPLIVPAVDLAPRLSENSTKTGLSIEAVAALGSGDLPLIHEAPTHKEHTGIASTSASSGASHASEDSWRESERMLESADFATSDVEGLRQEKQPSTVFEDATIRPQGIFCCMSALHRF